jgi:glycosyltransferase involved in cell wall biosynthesis
MANNLAFDKESRSHPRPKVSVVVPVYNGEATIEDCVNSLLQIDFPASEREIILVDNASIDDTGKILSRFNDRIRVVHETKRGAAAARNRGIVSARGEIVAFTDADCVVERGWLANLVAPLTKESIGIVGGKILAKRPCNPIEAFGESIHDHEQAINVYEPPHVITMNWASRVSVLRENLFDEKFLRSQDVDLSYRILQRGYRFVFAPAAVVYHRNERTFAGLFKEGFTHGFHSVQLIKKHKAFLATCYKKRIDRKAPRALATSLKGYLAGRNRDFAICAFTFNLGKKIGKVSGSVRYGHLDL